MEILLVFFGFTLLHIELWQLFLRKMMLKDVKRKKQEQKIIKIVFFWQKTGRYFEKMVMFVGVKRNVKKQVK